MRIQGILFEGKLVFLINHIADFFEVTTRTIKNYISNFETELKNNDYEILRGKRLSDFKLTAKWADVGETDFPDMKAPKLGIFDFRAFLNLGMLMVESERARLLRKTILDIVIDAINAKTGGGPKYINQRNEDFLKSWYLEENYHKQFTDALRDYVNLGNFKYPLYTDRVYVSIFREKASEYRDILSSRQIKKQSYFQSFASGD